MNANPLLNITDLIDYQAIRPEHIAPALDVLMGRVQDEVQKLHQFKGEPTWETIVTPLENATLDLGRAWGAVGHLQSVVDTPALRDAYNEALPKVTTLFLSLSVDETLFKLYKALRDSENFHTLTPTQQRIIEREIRDFKLSGAELPDPQRQRIQEIGQQQSMLSQKFSENLLDATNAWSYTTDDVSELAGIPEETLAMYAHNAQEAGQTGWRITLHMPSYLPLMKYADNRALREKVYRAYVTRASELDGGTYDNTPLMDEIIALRTEEAHLLGMQNFAELSLATKMATSPQEVLDFLHDLARRSQPRARQDLEDLNRFGAQLGLTHLEPWDRTYVSEKLREAQYAYSDNEVKRYFTESTVFQGLFHLVEHLFNIQIEASSAPTWHPDVKYFEVKRDGQKIAAFYADLYARAGKRSGAWMDSERTRCIRNGQLVTPIAYLVCNFTMPVNGQEATMTHDEVTTLFHEFGHTLHHILTQQTDVGVSGINGVEWDAVELPSQFLENFAWDRSVIANITRHVQTGQPLPDELFNKMLAAKNFESGLQCLRQVEFALFDMTLHTSFDPKKQTVQSVLDAVRQEVAVVPTPSYNRFAQSFAHIFAGGYAAGYYSYKWAEVLSSDCFSAFEENGILDVATGQKFLHEILERGSSRDAIDNFKAFRGREPQIEPLLRHTGII